MPRFPLAALGWLAAAALLPAQPPPPRVVTTIAFGSCADQDKPCPAWDAIAAQKPDLLVLLGDNIYADLDKSKKVTTDLIREKYRTLNESAGFRKLRAEVPILATWDDHDYGRNDLGEEWELKDESQQAFLDFLGVPDDSPRRQRKGVYHAETFGPAGKRVQVILLDGRYHRSPMKKGPFDPQRRLTPYLPNTDPTATVLGDEQWAWLEQQLKQPADLRLLCSGIQVVADEHPFEKWANFPAERERLFDLIRRTKANGVVALSGDRHLGEIAMLPSAVGYPLYDVTSSGLNQATKSWRAPEKNSHRVAAVPYGDNFGLIQIDWAGGNPRVSLQLRDEFGEVAVRHTIRLGLLKPDPAAAGKAKPAAGAKPAGGVLGPVEARGKLGEEVTVQFTVVGGRAFPGKRILLNSDRDFRSEANFTVVVDQKALTGAFDMATFETFQGKTIRAKGTVKKFNDQIEMVVEDAAQLEIVGK